MLSLTYFAFMANLWSAILVVSILTAMVVFIRQFRLYELEPTTRSSVVRVQKRVYQQSLNKIELPFSLKIGASYFSAPGSHLKLYSRSLFPCLFLACHNVSIDRVQSLINQPWPMFKETVESDVLLWPNLQMYAREQPHDSLLIPILCPASEGAVPRSNYGIMAIHMRTDETSCQIEDELAAVVTLIHIPDGFCKSPATILCQYAKCLGGRALHLKQLYSLDVNGPVDDEALANGNTSCVVCWFAPATHVLLPCRHVCLCAACFQRIDNCPVCRAHVLSYFLV